MKNLQKNVEVSQRAVRLALGRLPSVRRCACASALQDALVTPLELVPPKTRERLDPLIGRYIRARVRGD